jgi:PAS domain S-box-containing protein
MEPSQKTTKAASASPQNGTGNRATLGSLSKSISLYVLSFLILATLVVAFIWQDLRADYHDTLTYWNVQLSSSADERVRVSTLLLKERRTDTIAVADYPSTIRLLSAGGGKGKVAEIRRKVEEEIAHMAAVNGFLGGAVGDRDCQIAAQTGLRPEMAQGLQEACHQAQQTGEFRIDAFGMQPGHVWLNLSAPVMAKGRTSSSAQITHRMVGSVMMVWENWQDFILLHGAESVPTQTSETLLIWKEAGEASIFSPRLNIRLLPSFFRRPLAASTFESRAAREGDVAFGGFIDYRGVRVFGAAQRIAEGIGSVASKVDWDEALSAYHRHRVLDWLAGTLSLLLLGTVMVALHRHTAARDFAESARQQEALRERDRRYRVLFESAGDGIFLMRGDHFVDCNQKALELYGCAREQLIGNTPYALSPPQQPNGSNSQEAALEKIRLALEGQTLHFEWQHLRLDGTCFEAEVTLSHLEIAGEAHLLALVRDVTEHKQAEKDLHASLEQLRALAARLQNIREEERTRVAREIHDELGQALTVIKIDLSSLIHGLARDKKPAFAPILEEVDETIELVRKISAELRPALLDALGLVAAIEWAVDEFAARNGVRCRLDLPQDEMVIDPERATTVFRILQETLTNIARHAEATEVRVKLAKEGGSLMLGIQDNGKGITEEQVSAGGSLGILGMRERALLLGGDLAIRGAPRKGTTVEVRLPQAHSKPAGGTT